MSTIMDTPASVISPIRSAPLTKVPTAGTTFRSRALLRQSIDTYCHTIGKDCYQKKEGSGGYSMTLYCAGRKQQGCTFEVKAKRKDRKDTNNTIWSITSVCLNHTGCIYCLPSPKLTTLLKDNELLTYAATAKSDSQVMQHARMLRNYNIKQRNANRLRHMAIAHTLGYTDDPNIGFQD